MTQRARVSGKAMPWAKMDPDHRNALLLYVGIGSIILFALAIIGYGYYQSKIKPEHETVLTVGSRKYNVGDLARRMRSQILSGQISNSGSFADLASSTLGTMQTEELTRQSADTLGVELTDADVDNGIKNAAGLLTGAPQDVFAPAYRRLILGSKLNADEYRDIIAAQVIQQKYTQVSIAKIPDNGPQVKMHMIKVATQAKALELSQKLKSGAGFDSLAFENSADPSKQNGGDLGWVAKGSLPKEVDDLAFTLSFETASDIIETKQGFYIIVVNDRSDSRPLEFAQKAVVSKQSFDSILNDTRTKVGSKASLSVDQITFIYGKISDSLKQLTPPPAAAPATVPPPAAPPAPKPGG
jgi:parvulin-like peptidyl-prolyl isomerase